MRLSANERILVFTAVIGLCVMLGSAIIMIGVSIINDAGTNTTAAWSFLLVLTNILTGLLLKIDRFLPKEDSSGD